MRTRVLLAAVLAVAATGCVVHTEPLSGDVTVHWSFSDGSNCATVSHVQIDIPGQLSEQFNCLDGAEVLTDFAPGTYDVTVTGLDGAGDALYHGTSTFTVNGNVNVNVVMSPQLAPGNITVGWTFSDNDNCVGVDHIQIDIPAQFSQSFSCLDGAEVITNFAGGTYQVTVTALNLNGDVIYQGTSDVTVNGNTPVNVVLQPLAQSGNITVSWTFADGDNCVGVPNVQIDIAGQFSQVFNCTDGAEIVTNFDPGTYPVTVTGLDASNNPIYRGTNNVTVNGDVPVTVQLQSLGQPGNISLIWTFPGSASCSSAGVDHVVVTIPGQNLGNGSGVGASYPCSTGGTQGIILTNFNPGSYTVTLSAQTSNNTQVYSGGGSVEVNGDVTATFALQ